MRFVILDVELRRQARTLSLANKAAVATSQPIIACRDRGKEVRVRCWSVQRGSSLADRRRCHRTLPGPIAQCVAQHLINRIDEQRLHLGT